MPFPYPLSHAPRRTSPGSLASARFHPRALHRRCRIFARAGCTAPQMPLNFRADDGLRQPAADALRSGGRRCAAGRCRCLCGLAWAIVPARLERTEFQRLLAERNVVAHRASFGRTCAGSILSSLVAGEAEILSVAIAPSYRGAAMRGRLLDTHLRRLAGLGARDCIPRGR